MPIQFLYPELFLLAIPLWFAYRRWGRAPGVTGWLRLGILAALLVALTGPMVNLGGRGIDVIVVADRSRSMPAESTANVRELIQNLENNRRTGDRVGIVTFGSQGQLERPLSENAQLSEYTKDVLPDGSDLDDAIAKALTYVNPDRPARILVFSDGEANGASPLSSARRAREAGVPIDYRLFERVRIGDVAIESVLLPEVVSPREPFQFSVWIHADREARGRVRVLRDGHEITSADHDFHTGMNRLLFRDILDGGGFYNYTVELEVAGDPLLENNKGAGIVRVDAGPRLLVLNTDGQPGNLVRALQAGSVPVDVAVAAEHPVTQDALDPYRAVIVENVPADQLGRLKMERLAQFVEDLGGGLMLTGGERSFGTGGYFKSPLDDVLPVSMEMREEHRKTQLALAVALDRSGSMMATVAGGKTKMDLANLGTAESVRLLSAGDMVAVIAVDSSPHVIQSLVQVDDPEAIVGKVLRIQSEGGGIFVYEALVAAGKELMKAGDYKTRHIILFSDAADSEEPGDYKKLLKQFESAGITVSVIGLGTPTDVDSRLLEDIAKLGNGNIMFTNDAEELPRLFTQDTMSVARSSFIKRDDTQPDGIAGQLVPDARLMGDLGSGAFPKVDGYNLSYLKPDATMGVVSQDDYLAPWAAFWYRGLGRAAALTLEVDGQYSGQFGRWDNYEDFLITHARWLLGGNDPNDAFVALRRDGQDAVVTVELDPERGGDRTRPPELIIVPPGAEREATITPDFTWTGPNTLEARFRMDRTGSYRTLVSTGERKFTRGPAVTLPYSPEFVPRIGLPTGNELMAEVAELSGGKARTDVLEVLRDPPRSARTVPLLPWLMILGIALVLLEIAGRRLSLWERLSEAVTPAVPPDPAGVPAPRKSWLPEWRLWRPERKPARSDTVATAAAPTGQPASRPAQPTAPSGPAAPVDAFEAAKQRARRRMQ